MPSTYTVNLGIEKPATGEQSGTWGDTTNVNFDIIDQAVNGSVRVTLTNAGTSGSPNDLNIVNGSTTSSEGRNKWIEIYSASDLGGSAYVRLVPNDAEKILFIRNSLAGSQSVLLFQGTYNASNDLEIPAGVDMVVKFDGAGASATVTDVFTKLRATEITTPTLTAGTADINGGSVDGATVGAASASTGAFTTLTASTSLNIASSTTVDGVLDEDDMSSDSATKLATQQSIKAYVDSQVGTVDTLAEILANGNTSGANNLIINSGQALTTNTINETTAGSGVTIDSVLLKDDGVNATNLEITNIKANDGTAAGSIANSTGNFTITNFISNSVDIGGGAIDGTNIGASSAATGTFTTFTSTGIDDNATSTAITIDSSQNTTFAGDVGVTGALSLEDNATLYKSAADAEFSVIAYSVTQSDYAVLNLGHSLNNTLEAQTALTVNDGLGMVQFKGSDGTSLYTGASIRAQATENFASGTDGGTALYFQVTPNNSQTLTTALTLDEDTNAIFAGGVVINEDGGDNDFRVESDSNTNMLFVDASANAVKIGQSSGSHALNVNGNISVNEDNFIGYDSEAHYMPRSDNLGATANSSGIFSLNDIVIGTRTNQAGSGNIYIGRDATAVGGSGWFTNFVLGEEGNAVFNDDGRTGGDFRVESDNNSNMIFVDASVDSVGIGTNSPSSTFALDIAGSLRSQGTAPGLTLYETDASNQQWIVGSYGGTIALRDVTAATYPFQITTGAPTNSILIQSGGVTVNDNSADQDFRVESNNNTHMLFVDAGNEQVAVGTSSLSDSGFMFGVQGSVTIGDRANSVAGVYNSLELSGYPLNDTSADYGSYGALRFYANTTYTSSARRALLTNAYRTNQFGFLIGDTDPTSEPNVIIQGGPTDALVPLAFENTGTVVVNQESAAGVNFRVESDNNANMLFVDAGNNRIGMGTSSPTGSLHLLDVRDSGGADVFYVAQNTTSNRVAGYDVYDESSNRTSRLAYDNGSNVAYLNLLAPGAGNADLSFDGTDLILVSNSSSANLKLETNSTERVRWTATTGVTFNENSNNYDFRVESDSNANMLFVDAGENTVSIGTSSNPADTGVASPTLYVSNALQVGSGYYTTFSNPNGRVFTLNTAGNGASAFIKIEGSDHVGYRSEYMRCTNASGIWTITVFNSVTSGTAPTFTIANNSTANPTITLGFNTAYSGGYCMVNFGSPSYFTIS